MRRTITVRTDAALRRLLERKAGVLGITVSELVRDVLHDALDERPLSTKVGHLRGALSLDPDNDAWRAQLRQRNWRP